MAKFNLKNVRVCFLKIWERHTPSKPDEKPAYKACIIVPKDHPQIDELYDAASEVLSDKFKSQKVADKWLDKNYGEGNHSKECAVKDGDERDDVTPEFEDCLYINAKNFKQPKIQTSDGESQTEPGVNTDGDDIEGQEIYSGCFCNVSIDIWAWDNTNGKGLGCQLLGLRFREDGEAFGGGGGATASDDDLDDDDEKPSRSKKSKPAPSKSRRSRDAEDDEDDEDDEDETPRRKVKPKARR